MEEKYKVIVFDVTSMPPNEIEPFYNLVNNSASITETKHDPQTNKMVSIRAFFSENDDFKNLFVGFSGVKYTDVTGTNLLDW